MGKLDGKVGLVTGATYGMALASAKKLVDEGAHVFITGRDKSRLDKALEKLGKNATGILADSSKLADLDKVFERIKREKGKLDFLFASAGTGDLTMPIGTITEDKIRSTFDLNVTGTVFTVQKALPLMGEGGSIVLNSSIAGSKAVPGASIYSASKAAVRSLGRTWAAELAAKKIRVNVISPGPIATGFFEAAPKELLEGMTDAVPMKRLGKPDEIGSTVLFLVSDDSSFITGSEISVDGGMAQF
jgi:NAD(P)-dependent dehydrogenase (short-subunit alcohol dehydrogenase family)